MMVCSMRCMCLLFWCLLVFLWEAKMLCMRHLTQPFLESSISYTWMFFQSPWWDWSVDLYLVMSCCDMFWLDHFGSLWSVLFWDICRSLVEDRNVLWFTWDASWLLVENDWIMWFILRCILVVHWKPMHIVIYILRYLTVACWEPMDIMINQGCLQLPLENCCDHDYHLMLLMEILMFLFWIIFWYFLSSHLYRAEVVFWFMNPWA